MNHTYVSLWVYGPSSSRPRHIASCTCGWEGQPQGRNISLPGLHAEHVATVERAA